MTDLYFFKGGDCVVLSSCVFSRERFSFFAVAFGMFMVLLGSTVPSGLYSLYQAELDLSPNVVTVIYSFYVVGVLSALILVGHYSDHIGRRPIMLLSVTFAVISSTAFYFASNSVLLCVGRLLSGFAVGLCAGSFTAALKELVGAIKGGITSTVITSLALAFGPLFSSLLASVSSRPVKDPFLAYAVLCVVAFGALLFAIETVAKKNWSVVAPRLVLQQAIIRKFVSPAIAICCAYGVNGIFQSVVPLAIRRFQVDDQLTIGLVTVVMLLTSALTQIVTLKNVDDQLLMVGLSILSTGLIGVAVALHWLNYYLFWLMVIIVGGGQGITFRSSLSRIISISPKSDLSNTVSLYYVVGYVATAVFPLSTGLVSQETLAVPIICSLLVCICILNILSERGLSRAR